jgi:ATP-binding cassette subfamily F protein 3
VAATATPLTTIRSATELSETEARRFLHRFLFEGDAVHTPVSQLSYGERRRLSLAGLVLAGANLLVLDEPTNHLDIPSREALEAALEAYEGAVLAVTHDRYFIDRFADRLFELRDGTLTEP